MFGPSSKDIEEMVQKFAENGQWKTTQTTGPIQQGGKVFINQGDNSDIKPLLWFIIILNVLIFGTLLLHILAA